MEFWLRLVGICKRLEVIISGRIQVTRFRKHECLYEHRAMKLFEEEISL
jgi:hypothetical protein